VKASASSAVDLELESWSGESTRTPTLDLLHSRQTLSPDQDSNSRSTALETQTLSPDQVSNSRSTALETHTLSPDQGSNSRSTALNFLCLECSRSRVGALVR
jgi:hypothetical protein